MILEGCVKGHYFAIYKVELRSMFMLCYYTIFSGYSNNTWMHHISFSLRLNSMEISSYFGPVLCMFIIFFINGVVSSTKIYNYLLR